ncbi:unnamed protein product [Amoebophrya sp. A120]|nr:unnamed protein product [Amoebophrya sp. A120]|eukprot:GSA120T00011625001.1
MANKNYSARITAVLCLDTSTRGESTDFVLHEWRNPDAVSFPWTNAHTQAYKGVFLASMQLSRETFGPGGSAYTTLHLDVDDVEGGSEAQQNTPPRTAAEVTAHLIKRPWVPRVALCIVEASTASGISDAKMNGSNDREPQSAELNDDAVDTILERAAERLSSAEDRISKPSSGVPRTKVVEARASDAGRGLQHANIKSASSVGTTGDFSAIVKENVTFGTAGNHTTNDDHNDDLTLLIREQLPALLLVAASSRSYNGAQGPRFSGAALPDNKAIEKTKPPIVLDADGFAVSMLEISEDTCPPEYRRLFFGEEESDSLLPIPCGQDHYNSSDDEDYSGFVLRNVPLLGLVRFPLADDSSTTCSSSSSPEKETEGKHTVAVKTRAAELVVKKKKGEQESPPPKPKLSRRGSILKKEPPKPKPGWGEQQKTTTGQDAALFGFSDATKDKVETFPFPDTQPAVVAKKTRKNFGFGEGFLFGDTTGKGHSGGEGRSRDEEQDDPIISSGSASAEGSFDMKRTLSFNVRSAFFGDDQR